MAKSVVIDHYVPKAVMRGLLDGDDFSNRVAGTCIYTCPRCAHRIRFRWRSFYRADGRSLMPRHLRRILEDLTPNLTHDEQSVIDFFCPTCQAPTRVIFSILDHNKIAYHFDIYAVLVGEGKPQK